MTEITIISGFLGAGKTTLIKKLLEEAFQGEKIVLIENEFGEIGIDGGFLKDSGIQVNDCLLYTSIEMLKRLKHPGIPSIVDVIEERSRLLIVMDYVEGLSLDTLLLQQGAQPQEKVLDWAKQLCRALLYLHSRKPPAISRDLKPSHVMERPDGTVVLIDFGAAREYRAGSCLLYTSRCV